jgi:uncharacterized membrane protein
MARKRQPETENQSTSAKDEIPSGKKDRTQKIMNAMINTSIILMSTLMGGFAQVMVETTGAMASGMAEAVGGKEAGDKVNGEIKQKLPEVDEKMKEMISDIRKDVYVQLGQKRKEIEPFLSDPVFDTGPKTIDKYNFSLPRLTEELNNDTLAQYSQLLVGEDPKFAEMFKELTDWMGTLPKFPEKKEKKSTSPAKRLK